MWRAVQAGEEQLPGSSADWNLQGTMLTNPQGLSPCDADCPRVLGKSRKAQNKKASFWSLGAASCMSVLRGRTGGEEGCKLLCFPLPPGCSRQPPLVAKMTRTRQDPQVGRNCGGRRGAGTMTDTTMHMPTKGRQGLQGRDAVTVSPPHPHCPPCSVHPRRPCKAARAPQDREGHTKGTAEGLS